jgi:hypothetical protein
VHRFVSALLGACLFVSSTQRRFVDHLLLFARTFGVLAALSSASGGEAVLIHDSRSDLYEKETISTLSEFYGLSLRLVDVHSPGEIATVATRLRKPETLAVLASEAALAQLGRTHRKQIQSALRRPGGHAVPMLVFSIDGNDVGATLKLWSGGAVLDCVPLANDYRPKTFAVGLKSKFSPALADVEFPAVSSPVCGLRFSTGPSIEPVLEARSAVGSSAVLLRAHSEVFFVPRMQMFDLSWMGQRWSLAKAFSSVAPFLLFFAAAVGEYGWHLDGHYANLTIDDAWLRQPFGRLDYFSVLSEMEKHNFHLTLAFVPWNFDRSESKLVELFRAHRDRFSISVHGNNHAHREFGDYTESALTQQVVNIKQAVARMERFQALTGIPYDRFMVFPHGVAPEKTFAVLKMYDFLGTANLDNIPLGSRLPTDPVFMLRPYTVAFADFPSFSRYPVSRNIPLLELTVDSFLGNPLLFYGHQNTFESGATAFNVLADTVNRLRPDTRWVSLGEIARHLYLLRRRTDGGFDVKMLANEMDLKNPCDQDAEFHVEREEFYPDAVRSCLVDGAASFNRSGNTLTFRLAIPAHNVRKVRISYHNDLDVSRQDTRKTALYPNILRFLSDFRDLYLSRSYLGTTIVNVYYGLGWNHIEQNLEKHWPAAAAIAALFFSTIAFWVLRRRA